MDICVIGLGEVGRYISSVLVADGNNVIVVDRNRAALNAVELGLDVSTLEGNGATLYMLERMGAASADLIIAASSEDESNMLACIFAKNLGAKKYLSGPGGKNYINVNEFKDSGIEVDYLENTLPEEYPQLYKKIGFINDISALDFVLNVKSDWENYSIF